MQHHLLQIEGVDRGDLGTEFYEVVANIETDRETRGSVQRGYKAQYGFSLTVILHAASISGAAAEPEPGNVGALWLYWPHVNLCKRHGLPGLTLVWMPMINSPLPQAVI